jgi:hypothetical protein
MSFKGIERAPQNEFYFQEYAITYHILIEGK